MSNIKYRPDIDGLRALAVLPVILFHAGADWLPGGFVGVDIFFVISGYLISSIILKEIKSGDFSFFQFYERRARRIIPALLSMLVIVTLVFQLISLPDQAIASAESSVAALFSAANFYFWYNTGYFAPASELMPFIHTWSLAVEEQFYFIFPIFLLFIFKLRLSVIKILFLGTVAAFFLSVWLSSSKPSVAYFLLPARVWELALGVLVAVKLVPELKSSFARQIVSVLALVTIILSFFYIRSSMAFPGWVALFPCLGAAILIYVGGDSWIAKNILACRPMVFIGLLSYSLYLWHWPILSALRVINANIHLETRVTFFAILATFAMALISWRYIEVPFRSRVSMTTKRMFLLLGGGGVVIVAIALTSTLTNGFYFRLNNAAQIAFSATKDIDPLIQRCNDINNHEGCHFGRSGSHITYAIVGDSHAAAIRAAVESSGIMGDATGTLYWQGGCPLLDGARLQNHPYSTECARFKKQIWAEIERNKTINTVILAGRWPFSLAGTTPETGGALRYGLVDDESLETSPEEAVRVFERSLSRTIARLSSRGLKVIVIGSVPEIGFDVPHAVALARQNGQSTRSIPRSSVEARAGVADSRIANVVAGKSSVKFVSIWEQFCGEKLCDIERNGVPLYYDSNHLTHSGAIMVAAPALQMQ